MTTSIVKQQYEQLPYPPRNPSDEQHRLLRTVGDDLAELNHFCFAGRRSFRDRFRCLVAGGGTGDAAVFLADQLRHTDAEIVYLDLSEASRRIAERRAAVRGLGNVRWITASLLDLPQLGLGTFDYINCSGVLHHLPEPKEGLRSLVSALRDDGALFLMLYATYGRRGIYDMQEILRSLLPETMPIPEKITEARALLGQLPPTNHFQRSRDLWEGEIGAAGYGDAGLYDLLLHSHDRAYDVDAIFDLLASSGLQLIDFTGPQRRSYQLEHLLRQPGTQRLCERLSRQQSLALAERLAGNIIKHSFYAARTADRSACIDDDVGDPTLCIVLTAEMHDKHEQLYRAIVPGEELSITYTVGNRQEVFRLPGSALNKAVFKYFDGCTPIEKIVRKVKISTGTGNTRTIEDEIRRCFKLLHDMGWAYLGRAPAP